MVGFLCVVTLGVIAFLFQMQGHALESGVEGQLREAAGMTRNLSSVVGVLVVVLGALFWLVLTKAAAGRPGEGSGAGDEALRESDERFRQAMEATSDGLWDWDITTDRERTVSVNQECISNHCESFEVEYRMKAKDGSWKWILGRGRAASRDAQGKALRMIGTHVDITERKEALEALREERMLTETLLGGLPGIFYLYTYPELRLVRWNRNHETLLGYGPGEIDKRSIFEWYPPEMQLRVRRAVEVAMEKGNNMIELPLLTKDGRLVPFLTTGIRMEIQGALYLMGVGIDITERKRSEEEREKLQSQLTHAQKMESVGRLAGGVAHDFNNMLQAILGNVSLALMDHPSESPTRESLEEIQKSALRSAELTRQLLAFARKQTVAPRVLDLNVTVEGMFKMLVRLIGEDIELLWQPGANLPQVKMDPSQIDQVLANLCVNARDSIAGVGKVVIETGSVVLDEAAVAANPGATPGGYVLLAISDNGSGMDREVLGHLFEPFFTTKAVGKGTGLGLATVYGIVKQNQGFINVSSELGRGTTIKIYLPHYAGKQADSTVESSPPPASRGNETILLVEDEPAILKIGKRALESLGYTVLAASTPGAAIRLASDHIGQIQMLITDVIMPEMNGRDLAQQLLTLRPKLKRLYMSGYTSDVIAHHGVLDEGIHFLQKPFTVEALAGKVREVLES